MSPELQLLLLAGCVVIGFGTQVLIGFGGVVVTLTLGAHLVPLEVLLPSVVPISLASTGYIVLRHGGGIDRALLLRTILPAMGVGFVVGAWSFDAFGASAAVKRGYGALVFALALVEAQRAWQGMRAAASVRAASLAHLASEPTAHFPGHPPTDPPGASPEPPTLHARVSVDPTESSHARPFPDARVPDDPTGSSLAPPSLHARVVRAAWLIAAGAAQGLYASGGPLVVFALGRAPIDKRRFRSTLCAVWLLFNSLLVFSYAWAGRLGGDVLTRTAWLVPGLGVAIVLGEWLHHRVDERLFRVGVSVILAVAGAALALR